MITSNEVQNWILNSATNDELNLIRELIRTKQRISYNIGDDVWFDGKTRGTIRGKIVKMNARTYKVLTDAGMMWTVDPSFLHLDNNVTMKVGV